LHPKKRPIVKDQKKKTSGKKKSSPSKKPPMVVTLAKEWWELKTGKRDALTPPVRLLNEAGIGGGDYNEAGKHFLRLFRETCNIQPQHAILDMGCGYGRLAKPLTSFLDPKTGKYVGFDVFRKSVDWAAKAFGSSHKNFSFHHINIKNKHYNPNGVLSDTTIRFEFPDASFDFIFLTSIFTHLMPPAVDHYLGEIRRLLKPGGKCFSTFFLLDEEARRLIQEGRTKVKFRHTDPDEGWMALEKDDPERCIAFPIDSIIPLFAKHGLVIEQPLRLGGWCERASSYDFQDIIISTPAA
jgi:SAM-dependent methyltransferase